MILMITFRKYFPGTYSRLTLNIRNISLQIIPGILLLFLILIPTSGFTQQYSYSVIKGKKQIGTLTVNCQKKGNLIIYSIGSEAKTGFIFNISINVIIDEIFNMGEMEHSLFIRKVNGIEMIKNTVDKIKEGYLLKHNDGNNKTIFTKVNYSMGAMYFIEPLNRQFVYSENYQQFVPVIEAGKNRYQVKFPDGNESYYSYSNGICTSVEVHSSWAVIFFKLNEEPAIDAVYFKTKF
jgi:hypothetical protein